MTYFWIFKNTHLNIIVLKKINIFNVFFKDVLKTF